MASNTASTWLGPSSISSEASGRPRPCGGALDDAQRLVGQVGPAFGEQVVAGMDHRHRRRLARPGGALGIERGRIAQRIGEAIDVELDLEAAGEARSPSRRGGRAPRGRMRRVSMGTGVAVLEPGLGAHPAGRRAPRAGRGSSPGPGRSSEVVGKAEAGQGVGRARLEHAVGGAVGGVLEQDRAHHADAVRAAPSARRRRRASCRAACRAVSHQPMRTSSMPSSRIRRATASHAAAREASAAPQAAAKLIAGSGSSRRALEHRRRGQPGRTGTLGRGGAAPVGVPAGGGRDAVDRVRARSERRLPPRSPASSAVDRRHAPSRSPSASVRRLAMITLSVVPRCSRVRSWIAPMLSTAHWSCRLMSSSPMPR